MVRLLQIPRMIIIRAKKKIEKKIDKKCFIILRSIPVLVSFSTTSDTSKIFIGKGILRLQAMVLRRPGSRDVRATFEQAQKQQF